MQHILFKIEYDYDYIAPRLIVFEFIGTTLTYFKIEAEYLKRILPQKNELHSLLELIKSKRSEAL